MAAGVSLGALQSWERGKYKIGLTDSKRLAAVYGVSIDDLESGQTRNADYRRVPPFFLLVHPAAEVSDEHRKEAERALREIEAKHLREAARRPEPEPGPGRPGVLRPV